LRICQLSQQFVAGYTLDLPNICQRKLANAAVAGGIGSPERSTLNEASQLAVLRSASANILWRTRFEKNSRNYSDWLSAKWRERNRSALKGSVSILQRFVMAVHSGVLHSEMNPVENKHLL
jgi:hypothetical protein